MHQAILIRLSASILSLSFLLALPSPAQTWDLGGDFSDSANPNGPWSYNAGIGPLPTYWPGWGWAAANAPDAGHVPMWNRAPELGSGVVLCKSREGLPNTNAYDLIEDEVANVTWTSPVTGDVSLCFMAWFPYQDEREFDPTQNGANTWRIYHGSTLLADGSIGYNDAFHAENPARFSGWVSVTAGDILGLEVQPPRQLCLNCPPLPATFAAFRLRVSAGPQDNDLDGDGLTDCDDNCPTTPNPDQADDDADGWGNACDNAPCGNDWIVNPNNGHEYRLTTGYYRGYSDTAERTRPDWLDAQAEAIACGGNLVTINDEAESYWLFSLDDPYDSEDAWGSPLWIGLTDAGSEGAFHWVSGEAATFTSWLAGQPGEGGQDAVILNPYYWTPGYWDDGLDFPGVDPNQPFRGIIERGNQQPTADAGPDQTVHQAVLVTLDGTESRDSIGQTLTFAWTQVAGPAVTLSDPAHTRPTFVAPLVPIGGATLTFQLVVSDGALASQDTTDVTVTNINNVPVALAGDDRTVVEGGGVILDGSSSYDPENDELTFVWIQTAGTPVLLDVTDPARPAFTAPLVGPTGDTLAFELSVSDGLASAQDDVSVQVENVNHVPTADAGADKTRFEGLIVTLDGSASSDPDMDALSHAWTQIGGPAVLLSAPLAPVSGFTAPDVGPGGATLVFLLTVDDGYGGFDDDEVTVTVQDGNSAPLCGLARPSTGELWPPNHKLVPVTIQGVTDPESQSIQITILSVTQDEPLNGQGDGDSAPDAVILGSTILLRAERSGTSNGRVYRITFLADDGNGGACVGSVSVTVPHSRGKNAQPPIDDGQAYDALGN